MIISSLIFFFNNTILTSCDLACCWRWAALLMRLLKTNLCDFWSFSGGFVRGFAVSKKNCWAYDKKTV